MKTNKPMLVSNFNENDNFSLSVVNCILYDLNDSQKPHKYTNPIYTKLHGIYGYLCVSGHKVYFFWVNDENVSVDDVSELFKVEYLIEPAQ